MFTPEMNDLARAYPGFFFAHAVMSVLFSAVFLLLSAVVQTEGYILLVILVIVNIGSVLAMWYT